MLKYFFILSISFTITQTSAPGTVNKGTCLCVTGDIVNARQTASTQSSVVGQVHSGECYESNGSHQAADGTTLYQLHNVHGQLAWVEESFLSVSTSTECSSTSRTARATFATGIVSQHCLQCICDLESQCKPLDCKWDVNSDSCGYFQIKEVYWIDCGRPGGSLEACSKDLHCSSQCVQTYMAKYINHYGCPHNCESYARMHNGGPSGCTHSNTLGYWSHIQSRGCNANS